MRDPYLYPDCDILKNKLNKKTQKELNDAEANYVALRLRQVALSPLKGDYHTQHFLDMHKFIFQDLYEWAGIPRTILIYKQEGILAGQSIEYSDPFDLVHDISSVLYSMRKKDWIKMNPDIRAKEFCDSLSKLWKIHPFREGNTRTTITFCCQFADEKGFPINRKLLEENAAYVRTALVAYNAYFADGSDFSKHEYLEKIITNALNQE